jgi:hypothetical protein
MALPTADDVYQELEGFGINRDVLSSSWIDGKISSYIVPFVERTARISISAPVTYEERYDGSGSSVLVLSRRPITSLVSVMINNATYSGESLAGLELDSNAGIIRRRYSTDSYDSTIFPRGNRNIKVTYVAGFASAPSDIEQAILFLACEVSLGNIANRTGGGNSLSTQGFTRQFGERGKYSSARNDYARMAMDILRKYMTGV